MNKPSLIPSNIKTFEKGAQAALYQYQIDEQISNAVGTLTHYIVQALPNAGGENYADTRAEMTNVVEAIVAAAVLTLKKEAA